MNDKVKTLLIDSIAVVVIMTLLQPFGINEVKEYKWLIVAGYGVLTFIGTGLSDFITTYIFRLSRDKQDENTFLSKRVLVRSVLIIFIIGAFICSYNALIFDGDIYKGWFNPDGTFTLRFFWKCCLYVAAVSFFITLFSAYRKKNRALAHHLQEAMELNRILDERHNASFTTGKTEKDTEQKIIIRGTTKESIGLQAENLLYIEAEGNYANVIYLVAGKPVRKAIRCTMKQLEESLADHPQIVRCHRAFLVNIAQIRHLTGNSKGFQLTLNGTDQKIPVSKTYTSEIHHLIENRG